MPGLICKAATPLGRHGASRCPVEAWLRSLSMPQENIALMAHLLRRAGFGANRDELEGYTVKGYEATVKSCSTLSSRPLIWTMATSSGGIT